LIFNSSEKKPIILHFAMLLPNSGMRKSLLTTLSLACFLAGCNRTDQTVPESSPARSVRQNAALGFRIDLRAASSFAAFTALNQATLTPDGDKLAIKASGVDPSIGIPSIAVKPGSQFAVRIDQTTPVDTLVEIFYTTAGAPGFSPDHVVSVPVKAGRSLVLFEINDPEFAGGLRFDPGQAPGDYILHQIEAFSSEPFEVKSSPMASTPGPSVRP
jgi:hypothetical protein